MSKPEEMAVRDIRSEETRAAWPDRDPFNRCRNGHRHPTQQYMLACNAGELLQDIRDDFEERAAIIEHMDGMNRELAEGAAWDAQERIHGADIVRQVQSQTKARGA